MCVPASAYMCVFIYLIDVHVAIGRLAVAVHPEGQQQGQGQQGDGEE